MFTYSIQNHFDLLNEFPCIDDHYTLGSKVGFKLKFQVSSRKMMYYVGYESLCFT